MGQNYDFTRYSIEEEELRIEINESLNVVERLNGAMDFIFYDKLGEITTNKIHDQELTVVGRFARTNAIDLFAHQSLWIISTGFNATITINDTENQIRSS